MGQASPEYLQPTVVVLGSGLEDTWYSWVQYSCGRWEDLCTVQALAQIVHIDRCPVGPAIQLRELANSSVKTALLKDSGADPNPALVRDLKMCTHTEALLSEDYTRHLADEPRENEDSSMDLMGSYR